MFYKAVWLLLQTCFTFYEITTILFLAVLKRLFCRSQLAFQSYDQRNKLEKIRNELDKLPTHLAIIIGPEELDVEDETIARIINYALWMKINFVTFYDSRPSKRRCNLQKLNLSKDVRLKSSGKCESGLSNGHTNGYKNGLKHDYVTQVLEVTPFEGQKLIGDVCRELYHQRESVEVKELLQKRTLLTQHLDEELSARMCKFKDPELCIILSRYMCTFGMLPWQTRFTEMYVHHRSNQFDARTFANILCRYANCEQRWGK